MKGSTWLSVIGAARKAGDFRVLWPRDCTSIHDVPWYLQAAIEHGFIVLSWFEHRAEEEVPKEHLWEDPEGLDLWWQLVKERNENGETTSGGRYDAPAPDMDTNALAAQFKRG